MVELHFPMGKLLLEVKGSHKFWALRSSLEIPLDHIKKVYADPKPGMGWFDGLKIAGADIPHIFRAGLFYKDGDRVFWDVRHPKKTIVIELEDEGFAKLIVEVQDPEAAIREIQAALDEHANLTDEARSELEAFLKDSTASAWEAEHPASQEQKLKG